MTVELGSFIIICKLQDIGIIREKKNLQYRSAVVKESWPSNYRRLPKCTMDQRARFAREASSRQINLAAC